MNSKTIPATMLDFANQQIDQLSAKEKFSLSELTTVVDALFAMSGSQISGSLVLAYILKIRTLRVALNADATLTFIHSRSSIVSNVPPVFQVNSWLSSNLLRRKDDDVLGITPMWLLNPQYGKIALRSVVWLQRESDNSTVWLQMQTSVSLEDHQAESEVRSAGVVFPALVGKTLQVVHLPARLYDDWRAQGLDKPIFLHQKRRPSLAMIETTSRPDRSPINAKAQASFYNNFIEGVTSDKEKLEAIPERERSTLTHFIISSQRNLRDLNKQLF